MEVYLQRLPDSFLEILLTGKTFIGNNVIKWLPCCNQEMQKDTFLPF